MQGAKENFKEFLKSIKKKARDWWVIHGKLWTKCFIEYIVFAVLFSFVGAVIVVYFDLAHTDANSARYMLSALVQSQAAIVAIVVSLTLIAVQLTASAYSPRVIRIFKENPDMWLLMFLYGGSIFYGLVVLKKIEGEDLSKIFLIGDSLEIHIISAYLFGIISFAMLFKYMLSIMDLLTSETIINRLKDRITKDNLLNSKEDPIQPIMDIVHGSIMKYDIATTRVGLKAVTERVINVFKNESIASKDEKKISEHVCIPLGRVGILAASREDEETILEVIFKLAKFWKFTLEKRLDLLAGDALESMGKLGLTTVRKGFDDSTMIVARYIEEFGITAVRANPFGTGNAVNFLGEIGIIAVKNGLEDATKQTVGSLIEIGKTTVINGELEHEIAKMAAFSLAELTLLNKDIVKTTIQIYESKLGEQDRVPFQKFIGLYKQGLKKIRTEAENTE